MASSPSVNVDLVGAEPLHIEPAFRTSEQPEAGLPYAESVEATREESIFSQFIRSPSPERHPRDTVGESGFPVCDSPDRETPHRLQIRLRVSPPRTKILLRIPNELKGVEDVSRRPARSKVQKVSPKR